VNRKSDFIGRDNVEQSENLIQEPRRHKFDSTALVEERTTLLASERLSTARANRLSKGNPETQRVHEFG
jgi:hypothetical protein